MHDQTVRKLVLAWVLLAGSLAGVWAVWQYMSTRDSNTERYPVTWHVSSVPSPRAQSVEVTIEDNRCASGIPVTKRLRPARIAYASDSVTITLDAEVSHGFQSCPKPLGPGVDTTTIALREPLGDRKLVDGHAS